MSRSKTTERNVDRAGNASSSRQVSVDFVTGLPFVCGEIEQAPVTSLTVGNQSLRVHGKAKLKKLRANIEQFGFVLPLVVNADGGVLAGEARLQVARELGLANVPVVRVSHLSAGEAKAFSIADNRLVELSSWNEPALKLAFEDIIELEPTLEIELTGFETAQIDTILELGSSDAEQDADDEIMAPSEEAISRLGDVWLLGEHRLICGDATDESVVEQLLGDERVDLTVTDPPYNVPIAGHVRTRGGKSSGHSQHREFVQASGEMADAEFEALLTKALAVAKRHSRNGALIYPFMDWRSTELLLRCGRELDLSLLNLCVWNKSNGGMGSLYRSKHELCPVFKVGTARHVNNIALGASGRYRTNVWDYAGVNSFGRNRGDDLTDHPTVKPAAMIADIIKDTSKRGDVIFDPFAGSGTVFVAAQRTGRKGRGIELDPLYVDTIIRRFEKRFGIEAVHAETGLTLAETQGVREQESAADEATKQALASSSRSTSNVRAALRKRSRPTRVVPCPHREVA